MTSIREDHKEQAGFSHQNIDKKNIDNETRMSDHKEGTSHDEWTRVRENGDKNGFQRSPLETKETL